MLCFGFVELGVRHVILRHEPNHVRKYKSPWRARRECHLPLDFEGFRSCLVLSAVLVVDRHRD